MAESIKSTSRTYDPEALFSLGWVAGSDSTFPQAKSWLPLEGEDGAGEIPALAVGKDEVAATRASRPLEEAETPSTIADTKARILVLGDGESTRELWERLSAMVEVVEHKTDISCLDAFDYEKIVVSGLDSPSIDYWNSAEWLQSLFFNLLRLFQVNSERIKETPVFVVTRSTQASVLDRKGVWDSGVFGMMRSLRSEFEENRVFSVDVDKTPASLHSLCHEIVSGGGDDEELCFERGHRRVLRVIPTVISEVEPVTCEPDSWYLVTGGFRGIGLESAKVLIERGARSIGLIGRSKPSEACKRFAEISKELGCRINTIVADAADRDFGHIVRKALPDLSKVRGVIHAAGALKDCTFQNQTLDTFKATISPRILGALSLDEAFSNLDFFLVFSSAANAAGNPGQSNYAFATEQLEAFCRWRWTRGLCATSIALGGVRDVGYAARVVDWGRFAAQGALKSISKYEVQALISAAMDARSAGFIYLPHHEVPAGRRFEAIRKEKPIEDGSVVRESESLAVAASGLDVEAQVRGLLATAFGDQVQSIPRDTEFSEIGVDSLAAVDLRNKLQRVLEISLPASVLFEYPTLGDLTDFLGERLSLTRAAKHEVAAESVVSNEIEFAEPSARAILHLAEKLPKHELDNLARDFQGFLRSPVKGLEQRTAPKPETIVLSGATGLLGAFVCRELLLQTKRPVLALARGDSEERATQRVRENLEKYGLWSDDLGEKLTVKVADLEHGSWVDWIGISPEEVDLVVHCAARVHHVAAYSELEKPNVEPVRTLVSTAEKWNWRLANISTTAYFDATSGEIDEHLCQTRPAAIPYAETKARAEYLVRQAAEYRGVTASNFRLPLIVGSDQVGIRSETYQHYFLLLLEAIVATRQFIPGIKLDLVAADHAARSIVRIAFANKKARKHAFHVVHRTQVTGQDIARHLRASGLEVTESKDQDRWRAAACSAVPLLGFYPPVGGPVPQFLNSELVAMDSKFSEAISDAVLARQISEFLEASASVQGENESQLSKRPSMA